MEFSARKKWFLATAVGVLLLGWTAASAVILPDGDPLQKQRANIGKQTAKLALCMSKAAIKCEKEGVLAAAECDLTNPASSTVPDPKNKIIPKLTDALTKCESKLDLAKKSATGNALGDYEGIGCPGDAIMGGADDRFADLAAFEASIGPDTRIQLEALTPTIAASCDDGDGDPNEPAELECGIDQASALLKYAKGAFKCIGKCEDDYKNLKGNGGPTDAGSQCNPNTSPDQNFLDCDAAALDKAQKKTMIIASNLAAVRLALIMASNDLYNQCDCGAGVGPCP